MKLLIIIKLNNNKKTIFNFFKLCNQFITSSILIHIEHVDIKQLRFLSQATNFEDKIHQERIFHKLK